MKVTKTKMINLMGETPQQEDKRLLNQSIKAILKGKDPLVVREIKRGGKGYLSGTSKAQRKMREKMRRDAGIKDDLRQKALKRNVKRGKGAYTTKRDMELMFGY